MAAPVLSRVGLLLCFSLCPGALKGSTSSGSDFKASLMTGQQFKVSSDRLVGSGIERWTPWYKASSGVIHNLEKTDPQK